MSDFADQFSRDFKDGCFWAAKLYFLARPLLNDDENSASLRLLELVYDAPDDETLRVASESFSKTMNELLEVAVVRGRIDAGLLEYLEPTTAH